MELNKIIKIGIKRFIFQVSNSFLLRNYDKKWTIEMDRFVHNLQGNESEVIERESTQSALTMKDQGSSLIEYNFLYSESKVGYK